MVTLACGGCRAGALGEEGTATDSDTTQDIPDLPDGAVPWFEVGWGERGFAPLEAGGELRIVWGAQGSAMFPMPVRGGNFVLPDDPKDYYDEKAPLLDLELDIEGHNDGPGGHFKRIANYPVTFDVGDDGTYEFVYVAVIVPDDIDPVILRDKPASLWVRLRPYGADPLEYTIDDLRVTVDDPP